MRKPPQRGEEGRTSQNRSEPPGSPTPSSSTRRNLNYSKRGDSHGNRRGQGDDENGLVEEYSKLTMEDDTTEEVALDFNSLTLDTRPSSNLPRNETCRRSITTTTSNGSQVETGNGDGNEPPRERHETPHKDSSLGNIAPVRIVHAPIDPFTMDPVPGAFPGTRSDSNLTSSEVTGSNGAQKDIGECSTEGIEPLSPPTSAEQPIEEVLITAQTNGESPTSEGFSSVSSSTSSRSNSDILVSPSSSSNTEQDNQKQFTNFLDNETIPMDIKSSMIELLENPSKKGAESNIWAEGYIYIFTSASTPNHYKIGRTAHAPQRRRSQWENCVPKAIHINDKNDRYFKLHALVERLIQLELQNSRRKYKCAKCGREHRHNLQPIDSPGKKPGTQHGEWFEIREEQALKVVNRWRKWICTHDPYIENIKLHPRWAWKAKKANVSKGEIDWDEWTEWTRSDEVEYFYQSLWNLSERLRPLKEFIEMNVWFSISAMVNASVFMVFGWVGFCVAVVVEIVVWWLDFVRWSPIRPQVA